MRLAYADPEVATRTPAPPRGVLGVAVGVGILVRVVQYAWDRSFWVDEASLVLNIRRHSVGQLLGRLDFHQAAPPLFLLIERGLFRAFGGSELALRLFPVLAACASVVVFAALARRTLGAWGAVVAVGLFAVSDRLVWHGAEVKPYGIDVLVAVVLLWVGVRIAGVGEPETRDEDAKLGGRESTALRVWELAIAGVVGVWVSYPAVLVFAGVSLALLPAFWRRGFRGWVTYLAVNVVVAAAFGAVLYLSVRAQQSHSLSEYWAEDFLPWRRPGSVPVWLGRHLFSLCNYACAPVGFLVLPAAGIAGWAQTRRRIPLAMLGLTLAFALIASALGRFPFDGSRLTAYLVPGVLLLAGAGADGLIEWLRLRSTKLAVAPAAVLIAGPAALAAFHLIVPRYRSHLRPAAAFVRAHASPDDAIFALQPNEFACYWPTGDRRVRAELTSPDRIASNRFWIVWAFPNDTALRRFDRALNWARSFASQREHFSTPGGCAYLFEINTRPDSPPPNLRTHHRLMSQDQAEENEPAHEE